MKKLITLILLATSFSGSQALAADTCTIKAYDLVNYHYDAAVLLWGPSRAVHNVAYDGMFESWEDCFTKARELVDYYPTYWKDSIEVFWYGVDHMYLHWEFGDRLFGAEKSGDVNIFSSRVPMEGNRVQNSRGELLTY
mgnify:CR=1 FL=1